MYLNIVGGFFSSYNIMIVCVGGKWAKRDGIGGRGGWEAESIHLEVLCL